MADKCPECPDEGLPGWMGTFADMMTLLFAFFVLMFSMATMDPVKMAAFSDAQADKKGGIADTKEDKKGGGKSATEIKEQMEENQELRSTFSKFSKDFDSFKKSTNFRLNLYQSKESK